MNEEITYSTRIAYSRGDNSTEDDPALSMDGIERKGEHAKVVAIIVPYSYRLIGGDIIKALAEKYIALGLLVDESLQNDKWGVVLLEHKTQ